MANFKVTRGDVVVVPFPYTDKFAEKRRPALVISNAQFHERHGLVWVAMITSAENAPWTDDISLPLAGTGLEAASVIRAAKIATIDSGRVVRVAGKIGAEFLELVDRAVMRNMR